MPPAQARSETVERPCTAIGRDTLARSTSTVPRVAATVARVPATCSVTETGSVAVAVAFTVPCAVAVADARELTQARAGSFVVIDGGVAVFGVPHQRWVEAVVAAVILRTGQTITEEELIAFCRERLAGYKTPKYVVIVDKLPKNASGKILKRELRDTYASLAETEKGAP